MIFINGKFLAQRLTGVQRYAYEISKILLKLSDNILIISPPSILDGISDFSPEKIKKIGVSNNLNIWEQVELPFYLRKNKYLILISLCNTGPLFVKNQLLCIHDIATLKNPKWFSFLFAKYYSFILPILSKNSKKILTVSNFSKKEITDRLNVAAEKVSVIYNAPASKFIVQDLNKINYQKEDYFLFVGSLDPRKNLKKLIDVFSISKFKNLKLIIVGAKSRTFKSEHLKLPSNVQILGDCDDETLSELYRKSRALINCSLYEGFGLPLIEAMASGCPLIVSNIPVFKEIAGDDARYFDPYSTISIEIAVENFMKVKSDTINEQINQNYIRSRKYTWENSATKLLKIIEEAVL